MFFPIAHTCFNGLELPNYSSKEVMRRKILYAIENTTSIDGDTVEHSDVQWEIGFYTLFVMTQLFSLQIAMIKIPFMVGPLRRGSREGF